MRWYHRTVTAAGLASGLGDLCYETGRAALPGFAAALGIPAAVIGAIEGLAEALASLMRGIAGWIAERVGRRKALVVLGYALTPLGQGLMALASGWPPILVGRLLGWLGKGLRGPLRDAILIQAVSGGERGRALGWHRALDTLGAVAGPLAAAALLGLVQGLLPEDPAGPWRVVLWLSLLPGLLAALVFARFVADPGQAPNPRFSLREALAGWPPAFRRYLAAVSLFGAGDVSPVLLVLAATTLLAPQWGALEGAQLAALLYALRNVAQLLASWPAGWLADRHEHRRVLALGYALGLAAMLLIALACLAPSPLPWLAAAFLASGLSAAFQETLESSVAAELSGLRGLALKLGVLGGANGLSRLAANTVVGALWTAIAPLAGFLWSALLMAAGTGLLLRTGR